MDKELCRICAKMVTNESKSLELFERKHNHILQKLKQLTGLMLKNSINLPKWICTHCQQNLQEAYSFRENFLKVQAYLKAELNKGVIKTETQKIAASMIKREIDLTDNISLEDHQNVINLEKSASQYASNRIIMETKLTEVKDIEKYYNGVSATDLPRNLKENLNKAKHLQSDDTNPNTRTINCKLSNDFENNLMQNHEKSKDGINKLKMFVCDQCGNHFYLRHHFLVHLRRHSGDKQYACEICPYKFFTNSELTRHMRKHTGERPFACKFCFRKFSDYSTRIKHERTHTNERPYTCTHCTKSFTNSYILKNHILTHTGEKLFSCSICHKSFSRRTHLAVHNRSVTHKQAVENEISGKDKLKEECIAK